MKFSDEQRCMDQIPSIRVKTMEARSKYLLQSRFIGIMMFNAMSVRNTNIHTQRNILQ